MAVGRSASLSLPRHPGEGRDLAGASGRDGEIPAFVGMTIQTSAA
jgi:hypothetical protein